MAVQRLKSPLLKVNQPQYEQFIAAATDHIDRMKAAGRRAEAYDGHPSLKLPPGVRFFHARWREDDGDFTVTGRYDLKDYVIHPGDLLHKDQIAAILIAGVLRKHARFDREALAETGGAFWVSIHPEIRFEEIKGKLDTCAGAVNLFLNNSQLQGARRIFQREFIPHGIPVTEEHLATTLPRVMRRPEPQSAVRMLQNHPKIRGIADLLVDNPLS